MGLRRGNLSTSNSNLSVSSDGVESDDSSKPRLRANKVMRMGSFAYRATQFFENLGKKSSSSSKRKASSLSSPTEADFNLKDGIQEESSISSSSLGLPAPLSPLFDDSFRHSSVFSSPSSSNPPPLPSTPPPPPPVVIKHQGYLNIFSSFNKRRWGQRWCLVRENMFECYRSQNSQPCELNFLLRKCVVRQALAETNSPLALMLLENDKEKITVEPPTKEELSQWLRVLMVETATASVPEGLEEFFVEGDEVRDDDPEYTDIMGASLLRTWEVVSVPILPTQDKAAADTEKDGAEATTSSGDDVEGSTDDTCDVTSDAAVTEKYLYTEVVKRPSSSSLEMLGQERERGEGAEGGGEREEGEGKTPRFTENLSVYNANKNTTDSGFYSVKGANSDSDSGSEVKADNVSPGQESSSPLPSPGETTGPKCNSREAATPVSDSVAVTHSGGALVREEEEEEEGSLEKTMTSDDLKEGLSEIRSDVVSGVGVDATCDKTAVCEGGVVHNGVSAGNVSSLKVVKDQDSDVTVTSGNPVKDQDGDVSVASENHVQSVVDCHTANGDGCGQRDKAKKKKKKSKNKKNKQRQPEVAPENHAKDSVRENSSTPQSQPANQDVTASDVTATRSSSAAAVESPFSHRHSVSSGSEQAVSAGAEAATTSAPSTTAAGTTSSSSSAATASGGEEGTTRGPEEDEVITDLRDRIGRLREKLVQIKRKRDLWDEEFVEFLSKRENKSEQTTGVESRCGTSA